MAEYILQFRERISRKASQELILDMAKFSYKGRHRTFKTDASVKRYLRKQGVNLDELIEKCRLFTELVPYFENLIGNTWTISEDTALAVLDRDGQKKASVQGPGKLAFSTYLEHFEAALRARDHSVKSSSNSDFLNAVACGQASIEGYIRERAEKWNKDNPSEQLIDSRTT